MSVSPINQAYVGAANTVYGQSSFKVQAFNDLVNPLRTEAYKPGGSRIADQRFDTFYASKVVAKHLGK